MVFNTSQTLSLLFLQPHTSSLAVANNEPSTSIMTTATYKTAATALFGRLGRLLFHTNSSLQATVPVPGSTPRADVTVPMSGIPSLKGNGDDAAFIDAFFIAVSANLSTYLSAQCAEGYSGRVCAVCALGYGSRGIATCKPCSRLNTVYYTLALLLTLSFLAWSFHSTLNHSHSPQLTGTDKLLEEIVHRKSETLGESPGVGERVDCEQNTVTPLPIAHILDASLQRSQHVPTVMQHHTNLKTGPVADSKASDMSVYMSDWHHATGIVCSSASTESMGASLPWHTPPTLVRASYSTHLTAQSEKGLTNPAVQLNITATTHVGSVSWFSNNALSAEATARPAVYNTCCQAAQPDGSSRINRANELHTQHCSLQPVCPQNWSCTCPSPPNIATTPPPTPVSPSEMSDFSPAAVFSEVPANLDAAWGSLTTAFHHGHEMHHTGLGTADIAVLSALAPTQISGTERVSPFSQLIMGSDIAAQVVLARASHQDASDRGLGANTISTASKHITTKDSDQDKDCEDDSIVKLQPRTSYFSDTRDPVIKDSNRAAMVVTRIFLSYLQVRDRAVLISSCQIYVYVSHWSVDFLHLVSAAVFSPLKYHRGSIALELHVAMPTTHYCICCTRLYFLTRIAIHQCKMCVCGQK